MSAEISTGVSEGAETRGQKLWRIMRDKRDEGKLSLERARLLTASYKETDGLPAPIRRARAFEKIITEIPIFIDDDQLLVGDFAARPMWAEWYPETAVDWVLRDIEAHEEAYKVIGGEIEEQKEICEFWKNRCVEYAFLWPISEEERERLFEVTEDRAHIYRLFSRLDRFIGYHVPDYEKLIRDGLLGIIAEVEEELQATSILDDDSFQKVNFLQALVIVYQATIQYARRYAALAREMAKTAQGRQRQELEKIADICEWVPANPARSFHEAVQTLWFTHVLMQLEAKANGISPGRADQYLYPYYRRDIDEGRLTKEEAIELLECLRVKMSTQRNFSIKSFLEVTSGEAQFHNVTLGGHTPDGKDATNELSYLFLEAAFRTRTPHHTLSIRCHDNLSEDFLLKTAELAATGNGWPAFFNDKPNIEILMDMGASLEEARDYAISGCTTPQIPGKSGPLEPFGLILVKPLELALRDGVDPFTGKQLGPKTGKFEDFKTYEELGEAYKKQTRYFSHEGAKYFNRHRALLEAMVPRLFDSGLIDDCIKRGKSASGAGPRYWYHYQLARGMIDAVDSLAAIKKCVYEDGSVSKQELMDALDANFEGKDDVRRLLMSAPKYGNDDDYVDSIAHDLYDWWQRMVTEELDSMYGHKYQANAYSASGHHAAGKKVMALPSGRKAGLSLADGSVSPCQGVDFKGPTAVINSASKIDQRHILSTLLNIKFQPATVKTKEDLKKFVALIKTYFDCGGRHVQFNVVDRETLVDAQVHPELHRNLLVRVAGYSALFVELDRGVQDEIIQRTHHTL